MELVKYDAACRAIAEARSVDDVKEISNRAEAARAYARQAKNRSLELDALEIRTRAERRLGEIILSLRRSHLMAGEGASGNKEERLTLKDLGIDGATSGIGQRLAKLPEDRFASELSIWRTRAETARNVDVPLQRYRVPSSVGDRQRTALKLGRHKVENDDPLAHYTAMDGRRVSDWRSGELDRLNELGARVCQCVAALKTSLPANPDPLDTMEMIFGPSKLAAVLDPIWASPVPQPTTGAEGSVREIKRLICEECGISFKPTYGFHKSRANEGRYCSRSCSSRANRKQCGT